MIKISNPNKRYFASDDEFYNFCVVPVIVPREMIDPTTGETIYYMDFDLSNEYHKAVADGIKFIIKDEDSKICKHGCVSYRTISKKVDNLEPFFDCKKINTSIL